MLTVMFISFILSLSMTTVANVLVVSSSAPFFSALLGWILLGERVPMRTWLAMAVAITGIVVMFVQALSGEGWQGMLLSLVIPVAFGVNIAVLRKMHASVDMIPGILLAGALSAFVTLPVALPFEATARDLGLLAIMGAVQLGLGCILMVIASRHLSAAEIGLTSILETVFGTLSVWLLVGEQPSPATLVGGAMVIGALAANQYVALRFRPAAA
jgi:drug/metabolite transporter (DMT)-like permease